MKNISAIMSFKMLASLGLLISVLVCSSCGDTAKNDVTVSGVVVDEADMKPLKDIRISLFQDNGRDFPRSENVFQEVLSDSFGNYSFSFKPYNTNQAGNVRLEASIGTIYYLSDGPLTNIYILGIEEIPLSDLLDVESVQKDLVAKPFGILTLDILNVSPQDLADQTTIKVEGDDFTYQFLLANDEINGEYVFPVKGDDLIELSWVVVKKGLERNFADTISSRTGQEVVYRMDID